MPSREKQRILLAGQMESLLLRAALFLLAGAVFPLWVSPGPANPQGPRSTESVTTVVITDTQVVT